MSQVNGDDVVVHSGDQVITLEQRLQAMQRQISRLTWTFVILITLTLLNLIVGPDRFWQIVNEAIKLIGGG